MSDPKATQPPYTVPVTPPAADAPMYAPSYAHVCGIPDKNGEQQQCQACEHDAQLLAARPAADAGTPFLHATDSK